MSDAKRTWAARVERERQVHQLLEQGYTHQQILIEVGISAVTLGRYLAAPQSDTGPRQDSVPFHFRPFDGDIDWTPDGLCTQVDTEIFFPEKGGSAREAKRVCAVCPVQDPCLQYALRHDERFGIWGGKSERERRRLQGRTAS